MSYKLTAPISFKSFNGCPTYFRQNPESYTPTLQWQSTWHWLNSCLFSWQQEAIPQKFKDASIIHLFKQKGNWQVCDNHSSILLLSIAGKILARILFNRLTTHFEPVMSNIHKWMRFVNSDGPLVPIEKNVIPMVLLVNMHLIKGTSIIFPIPMVHWYQ